MIRVIAETERELADVWARHDFAPLFGSPYRVFVREADGRLRSVGGGGITNTVMYVPGPASLPGPLRAGGAGGVSTSPNGVKRRRRK